MVCGSEWSFGHATGGTNESDAGASQSQGFREVRLTLPDVRSQAVRVRIAAEVAALDPAAEAEALDWIEAVSEFDGGDEAR